MVSDTVMPTPMVGPFALYQAQTVDWLAEWRRLQDAAYACYWQSLDQWGDLWRQTRGVNPFFYRMGDR